MDAYRELLIIGTECLIRRIAATGKPLLLKGSYLTRQYFKDPSIRLPVDLDWIYMSPILKEDEVDKRFNEWLLKAIGTDMTDTDGIRYQCVKTKEYWHMVDYSITQDVPTVYTNLVHQVNKQVTEMMRMDVSYNIHLDEPPVPLLYRPLRGKPFLIQNTAPLSQQISWKLHQTLEYPRFKDLFDLIHLLDHPDCNESIRGNIMTALLRECNATSIEKERLECLMNYDFSTLFETIQEDPIGVRWSHWRYNSKLEWSTSQDILKYEYEYFGKITTAEHVPKDLPTFLDQLYAGLRKAGLTKEYMEEHPDFKAFYP